MNFSHTFSIYLIVLGLLMLFSADTSVSSPCPGVQRTSLGHLLPKQDTLGLKHVHSTMARAILRLSCRITQNFNVSRKLAGLHQYGAISKLSCCCCGIFHKKVDHYLCRTKFPQQPLNTRMSHSFQSRTYEWC